MARSIKINSLKPGDEIIRFEKCGTDGSFMGDSVEYVGKNDLVFQIKPKNTKEPYPLQRKIWDDGKWTRFRPIK